MALMKNIQTTELFKRIINKVFAFRKFFPRLPTVMEILRINVQDQTRKYATCIN